jgi:hypothetical protein
MGFSHVETAEKPAHQKARRRKQMKTKIATDINGSTSYCFLVRLPSAQKTLRNRLLAISTILLFA